MTTQAQGIVLTPENAPRYANRFQQVFGLGEFTFESFHDDVSNLRDEHRRLFPPYVVMGGKDNTAFTVHDLAGAWQYKFGWRILIEENRVTVFPDTNRGVTIKWVATLNK